MIHCTNTVESRYGSGPGVLEKFTPYGARQLNKLRHSYKKQTNDPHEKLASDSEVRRMASQEHLPFRFDQVYPDDGLNWCDQTGLSLTAPVSTVDLFQIWLDNPAACQRWGEGGGSQKCYPDETCILPVDTASLSLMATT